MNQKLNCKVPSRISGMLWYGNERVMPDMKPAHSFSCMSLAKLDDKSDGHKHMCHLDLTFVLFRAV